MPRSLRSGTRQKKLQVQHIQQVNKSLRLNINNCIESNVDNFNQMEFLSLFGLTKILQSNGIKNGQTKRDGYIERLQNQHTENNGKAMRGTFSMVNASRTVSSNDNNEAFKIRYALGKPEHYMSYTMLHLMLSFSPTILFVLNFDF